MKNNKKGEKNTHIRKLRLHAADNCPKPKKKKSFSVFSFLKTLKKTFILFYLFIELIKIHE